MFGIKTSHKNPNRPSLAPVLKDLFKFGDSVHIYDPESSYNGAYGTVISNAHRANREGTSYIVLLAVSVYSPTGTVSTTIEREFDETSLVPNNPR